MIYVYFVDRDKIEEILVFLEGQLMMFEKNTKWEAEIEKIALERVCHTIIEAMMDVGNALIDGFIMRDPGSYDDIIAILEDEQVITPEISKQLKEIVSFRRNLVQDYINVEHEELLRSFLQGMPSLSQFAPKVRAYLVHALGPVTAFRN